MVPCYVAKVDRALRSHNHRSDCLLLYYSIWSARLHSLSLLFQVPILYLLVHLLSSSHNLSKQRLGCVKFTLTSNLLAALGSIQRLSIEMTVLEVVKLDGYFALKGYDCALLKMWKNVALTQPSRRSRMV